MNDIKKSFFSKEAIKAKFASFSLSLPLAVKNPAKQSEPEAVKFVPRYYSDAAVEIALEKKKFSLSDLFVGISTQEQIVFAKRLAILIKSGIPILTSLDMLEKQADSRGTAQIYKRIKERVEKGQPLSTGLKEYEKIFGCFAVNIVRVGEVSGTLTQNLSYLADELKKKQELRRNITGALVYPAFIVVATVGIVIMLMTYVFPKILPIFASFKAELPWSTKILIAASSGLELYWIHLLAGMAVFLIVSTLVLRIPPVKLWYDRNTLRLPFFGAMFRSYYVANFSRTLGLLLKSELGLMQSLRIVGDTLGNAAYRRSFYRIAEGVGKGEQISAGMADRLLFPSMAMQMVAVGETTGHLSSSLLYLSDMNEDELNSYTKNLSTSIEPALMIFMGLLVGFIAMSIITPIYGITQNLRP